ncbi:MAG: hypothetical protein U0793_15085 [Gemmataceae bacterium]
MLEADDELACLSGYPLNVVGDRASVASKKITPIPARSPSSRPSTSCGQGGVFDEQITAPSPGPIYCTRPPVLPPHHQARPPTRGAAGPCSGAGAALPPAGGL